MVDRRRHVLILGGLAACLATIWSLLALLSSRSLGMTSTPCAWPRRVPALPLRSCFRDTQRAARMGCHSPRRSWARRSSQRRLDGRLAASIRSVSRSSRFYSLLVVGRFFGELSSTHGILLFASPLLGWLPELPGLRRLPRWVRNLSLRSA